MSSDEKLLFSRIELFLFYCLFALAIYCVYVNKGMGYPFFLSLLMLAFLSKRYYFWIAFFFMLLQAPGYFFWFSPTSHLPFFTIAPSVSLTPIDLFLVMMVAKGIIVKREVRFALRIPFIMLGVFLIFSLFRGFLISESFSAPVWYMRSSSYVLWGVVFVQFIKTKKDVFGFLRLFLPITFFILFTELYAVVTEELFIGRFDPEVKTEIIRYFLTGDIRPMMEGVLAMFMGYIGALVLLQHSGKERLTAKMYFALVIAVGLTGAFISGSRVWLVIFLAVILGTYRKAVRERAKVSLIVITCVALIVFLMWHQAVSREYLVDSAWERFAELGHFFKGTPQQINTLDPRLTDAQSLLGLIAEKPMLGYGLSDISRYIYDSDLGLINTILVFGITGFILFLILIVSYIKRMCFCLRQTEDRQARRVLEVLLVTFYAILLAYSTTWDFFSFNSERPIAFMMVFFGISEVLSRARAEEHLQV